MLVCNYINVKICDTGGLLDGDMRSTEYHFRCLFIEMQSMDGGRSPFSIETVLLIYDLQKKIGRLIDCYWTVLCEV